MGTYRARDVVNPKTGYRAYGLDRYVPSRLPSVGYS
jgi:hypothetical protein